MESKQSGIQNELETLNEKVNILYSTLQAIYTAQAAGLCEGVVYGEAIHGTVHLVQELKEGLQTVLQTIIEGEDHSL